jgi:tetratricopeptide (TPR) repeat protein
MESLLKRSLKLAELKFGTDSSRLQTTLINLGSFFLRTDDIIAAEQYFRRAVNVTEREEQVKNTVISASAYSNLAATLAKKKNVREAEQFTLKAIEIYENANGPFDPAVGRQLISLSGLYRAMSQTRRAVAPADRAASILKQAKGEESVEYGEAILELAQVHTDMNAFTEAEPLFIKAVAIFETTDKSDRLASVLGAYAQLLDKTKRPRQAKAARDRMTELRTKLP